jgi:DNA-binding NarL/FixJ family response regulator
MGIKSAVAVQKIQPITRIMMAGTSKQLKNLKDIIEKKGYTVVRRVTAGRRLVKLSHKYEPDIVIMDTGIEGISPAETVMKLNRGIRVIILAARIKANTLPAMLAAGVKGYLINYRIGNEIIQAITAVQNDEQYFCANTKIMVQKLRSVTGSVDNLKSPAAIEDLKKEITKQTFTKGEFETINLVCKGFSNQEIADYIGNGIRTVQSTRLIISKKTGTKNTASLVVYAIRNKIFDYKI